MSWYHFDLWLLPIKRDRRQRPKLQHTHNKLILVISILHISVSKFFELTSSVESSSSSVVCLQCTTINVNTNRVNCVLIKSCGYVSHCTMLIRMHRMHIWICIGRNKEYATHKYTIVSFICITKCVRNACVACILLQCTGV